MRAGFYLPDAEQPVPAIVTGLDSMVQLGLIRLNGAQSFDQMTEVIALLVRSNPTATLDSTSTDYLTAGPPDEDYGDSDEPDEDFGENPLNLVNCNVRLIATVDGITEFLSVVPDLVRFDTYARHYTCSIAGIWHIVEVAAIEPGEALKIHSLELTVIDAGRLG